MSFASPFIAACALVMTGVIGLVMGSFINCWAWRFTHGESVVSGRSHCATCNHALGARDLVPVLSWLVSGGKCRYCGQKVSARYPATEIVCAAAFVGVVAVCGLSLEALQLIVFAGVLLFLSLTDIDERIIPNGCIAVAAVVRLAFLAAQFAMGALSGADVAYYIASGLGMGAVLVIVVLAADRVFGRESMGGGDLKLYAVAGLYFGWQQGLFLVLLSCIIGIVVAFAGTRASEGASTEGRAEERAEEQAEERAEERAEGAADTDAAEATVGAVAAEAAEVGVAAEADLGVSAEVDPGAAAAADGETAADTETAAAGTAADMRNAAEDAHNVMKRAIPFGPSIAAACYITMLVGDPLITWYLSLMG